MAGLKSLCENHSSGPECVAPTVLRIMLATVPSPYGLGYVLARLRRSGFVARTSWLRLCRDRFAYAGWSSRIMIGDLWFVGGDLSVAAQRRRRERP